MAEQSFGGSPLGLTVETAEIEDGAVTLAKLGALTTKGDLLTYSTSHQRLGVGNDNQVLTADSSAATGLKWTTPAGKLELVEHKSLSNSANADFTGLGSYKYYILFFRLHTVSATTDLTFRLNNVSSADYEYLSSNSSATWSFTLNATEVMLNDNSADSGTVGAITFMTERSGTSNQTLGFGCSCHSGSTVTVSGRLVNPASDLTQITLTGTANITGTATLYGVKET